MSMLAGVIVFVGTVTGEANHQASVPKGDPKIFVYSYTSSFVMLVMAFCLNEVAGVLSVYIFIIRHKESVKRKHATLSALKNKPDHAHRRRSRNASNNSSHDGSHRQSFAPTELHEMSSYSLHRDQSHVTLMTTVESHHNLKNNSHEEERLRGSIVKNNYHSIPTEPPPSSPLRSLPQSPPSSPPQSPHASPPSYAQANNNCAPVRSDGDSTASSSGNSARPKGQSTKHQIITKKSNFGEPRCKTTFVWLVTLSLWL